MKNNDNETFENQVKELKKRRAEKMRLEQEAKAEEENKYRNQCEARKEEIARLIASAEHSIRSLLADSEGKFLKYLTNVFKGYTNHPFEDLFGLCGFTQQPVQEASFPPVENAGIKSC